MDSLSSSQFKTNTLSAGIRANTTMVRGGARQQVQKQESVPAIAKPTPTARSKEAGVSTEKLANGQTLQSADSGMTVLTSENEREIQLPSGEGFRWNDDGLIPLNEESSKGATLTTTEDGLALIRFQDRDQNTVQIQPDSLTYEVLNKSQNLAQVYHPDGHQEVVAFGRYRSPEGKITEYQHNAVYDPNGGLADASGFQGLSVEGNKLSFDLENGMRTERTLARPLPGQPAFKLSSQANLDPQSPSTIPLTLLSEPAPTLSAVPLSPTEALEVGSTPETPFASLTDIKTDFFAGADIPGVQFDETRSGLVMRQEGETRAFLLPNGDSFRTNGKDLEVLGDSPRAKNARIVDEGDSQLLAYSDPDGNHHQLDISTGDYEVSNRQGSLSQGFKADGTTEYGVRGSYTTESGKPQQYFHKVSFGESGTLLSKEGFDDLKISGQSMSFTLPNGVETDRKLIQATEQRVEIPRTLVLSGGVAEEWGGALALADEFLGRTQAVPPAAPVSEPTTSSATGANQVVRAPSGLSREPLKDGSGYATTLPNGIRIEDGKEVFAVDPEGNRLSVFRTDPASPQAEAGEVSPDGGAGNYLLSLQTPNGVGYTIASNNLDLIVASGDGKVLQLVGSNGKILTSIRDGQNQHLHETDSVGRSMTGSPGTRTDPRFPDRLFVDGSPVGSYQLPHPLSAASPFPSGSVDPSGVGSVATESAPPTPNGAGQPSYMAGPGEVQQGFQPSFWQRMKGSFTGDTAWEQGPRAEQAEGPRLDDNSNRTGGPGRFGGFPGSHQQYDPLGQQWREIERMNKMMMWSNVGMSVMSSMSMMNMMFYPMGF